jgi:hypothetical protein
VGLQDRASSSWPPALAVREDVVAILGEFGGMSMGAATNRVPQVVAARYEVERVEIEREIREVLAA